MGGTISSSYHYPSLKRNSDHMIRQKIGSNEWKYPTTINSGVYKLTEEHRQRLVEELAGAYPNARVWCQQDEHYHWGYFPIIKAEARKN